MKISELVKAAKAANPKSLGNLPEKRATKVAALILAQIGKELDSTTDGKLSVMGFGRFQIKQAEVEKDGAKVMRRRISFRRSGAGKGEKGEKTAGGGKGGKGKGKAAKAAKAAQAEAETSG